MTNLSSTFFISQTCPLSLTEHTNFIWKHPVVIVETFKSKSILRFQGIILLNPFAGSWCLNLLANFLVACICTWRHFLGVQLYSNYTISHQIFERVLCLILPSRLVKSVSSASILRCQSFSKSASQGEGCCIIVRDQYSSWGSTVALNCFLTLKGVSRMTRGRSRKRHRSSRKSRDENDHYQTGQGGEIATPPAWCTSPRRGIPEEFTEMNPSKPLQTEPWIGNDGPEGRYP